MVATVTDLLGADASLVVRAEPGHLGTLTLQGLQQHLVAPAQLAPGGAWSQPQVGGVATGYRKRWYVWRLTLSS